ncbi:hypothetical protein HanIR_Chr08g0390181 [Helianthus annuus]|nr:hypothetical protein HanIR_Chr08g0390181 [Helianthus annuus]
MIYENKITWVKVAILAAGDGSSCKKPLVGSSKAASGMNKFYHSRQNRARSSTQKISIVFS